MDTGQFAHMMCMYICTYVCTYSSMCVVVGRGEHVHVNGSVCGKGVCFTTAPTLYVVHGAPVCLHSIGETKTVDFTFQPGTSFPLDVYFLMDFGDSEFGNFMLDDFRFFGSNLNEIRKLPPAWISDVCLYVCVCVCVCVCESQSKFVPATIVYFPSICNESTYQCTSNYIQYYLQVGCITLQSAFGFVLHFHTYLHMYLHTCMHATAVKYVTQFHKLLSKLGCSEKVLWIELCKVDCLTSKPQDV